MDANFLKLIADAGTVAILLYVLLAVLKAYGATVNRITDLLEDEKESNDSQQDANASK